jgi:hypothetical protein
MLFNTASHVMSNGNRMITSAGPEWTGEEVVMT